MQKTAYSNLSNIISKKSTKYDVPLLMAHPVLFSNVLFV